MCNIRASERNRTTRNCWIETGQKRCSMPIYTLDSYSPIDWHYQRKSCHEGECGVKKNPNHHCRSCLAMRLRAEQILKRNRYLLSKMILETSRPAISSERTTRAANACTSAFCHGAPRQIRRPTTIAVNGIFSTIVTYIMGLLK